MLIINARSIFESHKTIGDARYYPNQQDSRVRAGSIFPKLAPKFQITRGSKIFTIGSCFARNIEEKLKGFILPTRSFSVPKSEWPYRSNGILNEFNPGTMVQRVELAERGESFQDR